MKMTATNTLFVAIGFLAGCGGSGGSSDGNDVSVFATTPAQTLISQGATATPNANGGITFATPEISFATDLIQPETLGELEKYVSEFGTMSFAFALHRETDGSRIWLVTNETDAGGVSAFAGGSYERLVATSAPTSGSTDYTGFYYGFMGTGSSAPVEQYSGEPQGDVMMTVHFGDNEIAGTMTNRTLGSGGSSLEDITFEATPITTEGAFAGTVSGGEFTDGGRTIVTPGTGSYEGVIAGQNAEEVIGGLALTHTHMLSNGMTRTVTEFGIFYADQISPGSP